MELNIYRNETWNRNGYWTHDMVKAFPQFLKVESIRLGINHNETEMPGKNSVIK
jgi:hypothetical protein